MYDERLTEAQAILRLGKEKDHRETAVKQACRFGVGLGTILYWQQAKGRAISDKQWQKLLEYKKAVLDGTLHDVQGYLE